MKCFYHNHFDAVALCKNCNRGVCTGCAIDVTNGTACRDRCEAQVAAVNEIIERGKTGYQKTSDAYMRNAILYGLLGAVMCLVGALTWPTGIIMLGLGVVMLIGAMFSYSSSRKIRQVGP